MPKFFLRSPSLDIPKGQIPLYAQDFETLIYVGRRFQRQYNCMYRVPLLPGPPLAKKATDLDRKASKARRIHFWEYARRRGWWKAWCEFCQDYFRIKSKTLEEEYMLANFEEFDRASEKPKSSFDGWRE